ncbi:MAG: diacylglycerol kinase family lipid kinase [Armatimonadetes bacterium]|nr:diacylglycerol kinase family lipid kinase [Armatimonadota bacterium]
MNALLIFNPAAGQGRPAEALEAARLAFSPFLREVVVTQGRGDAEAAARRAAECPGLFDAVLVAGGDGTLNEVLNGVLPPSSGSPRIGGGGGRHVLPVGLIPLGTRNVLARELGVPRGDMAAQAAVFERGRTRVLDLGRAGGQYFSLVAGFGFDAAVVREVALPVKELIGPAAYAFATLGALARYRSTRFHLTLDGQTISADAFLVLVANVSSYAFRQIRPAPFAAPDDGWLDICVFERAPTDKVGFVTQVLAVLARRHLRDPRVRYYRARRIEIMSDPPVQAQLDGDITGLTPLTMEVVPKALTVFVP